MKILFLGDSITDMFRNREADFQYNSYGFAYPLFIESGFLLNILVSIKSSIKVLEVIE